MLLYHNYYGMTLMSIPTVPGQLGHFQEFPVFFSFLLLRRHHFQQRHRQLYYPFEMENFIRAACHIMHKIAFCNGEVSEPSERNPELPPNGCHE